MPAESAKPTRPRARSLAAPALALCGMVSPAPAAPEASGPPPAFPEVAGYTAFIPQTADDLYQSIIARAMQSFGEEKYDEALAKLEEAQRIVKNDPFVINLKGAAYTKQKKWDEARRQFIEALSLAPNYFPARFNLGELMFLEGDREGSLQYFENLNRSFPRNELVEFKLVVLFSVTGREKDAARTASRMRYPGDTPAWYFANAALEFRAGRPEEARRYIRAAQDIFDNEQLDIYFESLHESGLMK